MSLVRLSYWFPVTNLPEICMKGWPNRCAYAALLNKYANDTLTGLLWSPYEIEQTIIFSSCFFFLLSFCPRLISAVRDWMSTILPHMVWP